MVALIILLVILAVIALIFGILMLRGNLHITYRDDLGAVFHLLGLRLILYPEQKEKINFKYYSTKALKKRRAKAQKKRQKQQSRPSQPTAADLVAALPIKKKNPAITILFILRFCKVLFGGFFGYAKLRVSRIRIKVATDDPAKTAVLFGSVNAAVLAFLELLDQFEKFGGKDKSELSVTPDFTGTQTDIDVHIVFSLRVWQWLVILYRTALNTIEAQYK